MTNLELQPWMVGKTYRARAPVEKSIRERLNSFALNKIPTPEWGAHGAWLQRLLWGDNIVHGFQRWCLPQDYLPATGDTIRQEFWVWPGKRIRQGGRKVLPLPRDDHHRQAFLPAARTIPILRLPEPGRGEKSGPVRKH